MEKAIISDHCKSCGGNMVRCYVSGQEELFNIYGEPNTSE